MSRVDLKVVMLGKEYCGKTSLVERYLYDRFNGDMPYQNTIGAAFGAKKLTYGRKTFIMGIWDTAGAERYESMSRLYYRGAGAAIVCYDVTDETSFTRTRFWVSELKKTEKDCKIYLCGTKIDLIEDDRKARRIDYHNVTDFADEIGAQVFETSSKTGVGVSELYSKIAEDYVNNLFPKPESASVDRGRYLHEEASSPKKQCPCW